MLIERISTDPDLMAKIVDPDKLHLPGNFFVTDVFGLYEKHATTPGGSALDDGQTYNLRDLTLPNWPYPRWHNLISIEGNEQQGTAFAVVVGSIAELQRIYGGPIVRMQSTCGFSEVGRELTAKLYNNPRWIYDHREELLPIFAPYGDDGMIVGYPSCDAYLPSTDCDCQAQRHAAQAHISSRGGIYISLSGAQQEGRGHGPNLKEKAYQLQDALGVNTKEAFDLLDLDYDIRQYGHVVSFVQRIGLRAVTLLTNNRRKIAALETGGVSVMRIASLPPDISVAAQAYLHTKGTELDHELPGEFYEGLEDAKKLAGQ